MPCVTSNDAPPKVPACATYAIDVQPIPPRQRNNRVVHHGYLNHLRDTLDTLHEIVEEARCCSKHMTGDRSRLKKFIKKFIGTVRFGNDHFGAIIDLEAAFRKHTCFVRDLDGVNLIKGSRGSNLYTISVEDMMRLRLTHGMTPWKSPVLRLADGTCSTMDDHDQRLEGQSRIKG
nr:integrase, catalytic region, zinc finger, CCHC-type, peptidase aspartic, catalytic [Tanacetum cinerariifolium]